jgi:ubiquinone/menaquinone biosynthesis C-methylase UbiE
MKLMSIIRMIFSAITKPRQHIILDQILEGRVIDIGGGGEAVIGQVGGGRVIALDKHPSEIREAMNKAPAVRWLVADAMCIPCESGCFEQATAFFSCMYMGDEVKEKVFKEVRRVLKKGGELWVWDVQMLCSQKEYGIRVEVEFRDKRKVKTMYGVRARDQSTRSISKLLQGAGFATEVIEDQKHWFVIRAT